MQKIFLQNKKKHVGKLPSDLYIYCARTSIQDV